MTTNQKDKLAMWIAWRLPRRLVMWCYIRVGAHATTGQYGNESPTEVNMMEALQRWSL